MPSQGAPPLMKRMSHSSSSPSLSADVLRAGGAGEKAAGPADGDDAADGAQRRSGPEDASPKQQKKKDERERIRRENAAAAVGTKPGRFAKMMTRIFYPEAKVRGSAAVPVWVAVGVPELAARR